jgi:hypothetical protein
MCHLGRRYFNSLFKRCGADEALLEGDRCHICGKQVVASSASSFASLQALCKLIQQHRRDFVEHCSHAWTAGAVGGISTEQHCPYCLHAVMQDHIARRCPDRTAGPILPGQLGAWGRSPRPLPALKVGHPALAHMESGNVSPEALP